MSPELRNPVQIIIHNPKGTSGGEQVGRLETGTSPIFTVAGVPWRSLQCTAFALPMLHAMGEDIDPFLDWAIATGFNELRCFFAFYYIPTQMYRPGFQATPDQTRAFLEHTTARGIRVFWTCGDMQILMSQLAAQRSWFGAQGEVLDEFDLVTAETCNECFKNGVDVTAIGRWTKVPLSSGVYWGDLAPQYDFGGTHTPRDDQWVRKAKELYDLYAGWASTSKRSRDRDLRAQPKSFPGAKIPWCSNEPMGADEVNKPGSRSNVPDDFFDEGANAGLMGAGGTFHATDLVYGRVPRSVQQSCAESYVAGSTSFDAGVALGSYTRGYLSDCPLEHDDDTALRTFARIRGARADALVIRPTDTVRIARDGWRIVSMSGPDNRVVHLER